MKPPVFIPFNPLSESKTRLFAVVAVVSFHLAYCFDELPWFMGLFIYGLFRLAALPTGRQAFLYGTAIGLAVYAPHLLFFWTMFGPSAITLWCILAVWLGLFLFVGRACLIRFGPIIWAIVAPFLWTGLEYFRSEVYYLRFSWLNVGYAFSNSAALPFMAGYGVYGIGFLFMAWAAFAGVFAQLSPIKRVVCGLVLAGLSSVPLWLSTPEIPDIRPTNVTGIQLEGSPPAQVLAALDAALNKYPQTDLFVLSEYTFQSPVPAQVLAWCKEHHKWLAVGGEEPIPRTQSQYYNTVFVVGPDGAVAFKQAKSVPVQFFNDGVPAREQRAWDSPWGKLGFGICYDASYTRVTDELIHLGAQALIFPSMDSAEWGKAEHELHARIAPMRAAEYLIPIFRLGSSGISQYIGSDGHVMASAPFPGEDAMLNAPLELTTPGRVPLDRPVAQLATVLTGVFILFMICDKLWAPRIPEP